MLSSCPDAAVKPPSAEDSYCGTQCCSPARPTNRATPWSMSNLILPPYAACVFVDDTGHEHLAGTSFYGLGACAVLGCEYDRLIRLPWLHVRNVINGDPTVPLHASDVTGKATPEQLNHIARFFREQPFGRLGAAGTNTTVLPDGEPLMRFVVDI